MQLLRNYTSAAAFRKQLEKSRDKRQHCARKGDIKLEVCCYTGDSGMSKVEPRTPTEKANKDEERTTIN